MDASWYTPRTAVCIVAICIELVYAWWTRDYFYIIFRPHNFNFNFRGTVGKPDVVFKSETASTNVPYQSTSYTSYKLGDSTVHHPITHVKTKGVTKSTICSFDPGVTLGAHQVQLHVSKKTHVDVTYDVEEDVVVDGDMVHREMLLAPATITIVGTRKGEHVNVLLVSTRTTSELLEEFRWKRRACRSVVVALFATLMATNKI
jgi:hypothetical protein